MQILGRAGIGLDVNTADGLGDFCKVGALAESELFALEVGQCFEVALFILADDELRAGNGVGRGEVEGFLALVGNADLVDHHVVFSGLQAGQDGAPFAGAEIGLDAQFLRQGIGQLDLEAGQLAVFLVVKRRVRAFQRDFEGAALLHAVEQVGCRGAQCQ